MTIPVKLTAMLSKKSPEIWLGAGIIAIVGGTVLACRASRKLDDILDEHKEEREVIDADRQDEIDDMYENGKVPDETQLVVVNRAYKKECAKLTVHTGLSIAREYAPAVVLIVGGIGMIINGHNILSKRNSALLSAYGTLEQSFNEYRNRVKERYGEEVEDEIHTGKTYITSTRTEIGEDGKKKKIKEEVPVIGTNLSRYARFFDEANSTEWTRSPDFNRTFIVCQQNSANDKLRARGYLFLNEVYRMLGMSETPTGAICGWILPEEHDPLHEGDDYVDFRIFDGSDPAKMRFLDGSECSVLLDFNCQGIIYDKI